MTLSLKQFRFCFCILSVFFITSFSYSQDQKYVDSILNVIPSQDYQNKISSYRRLFVAHIYVSPELAKPFLDSSMAVAKRNKDNYLIASTIGDNAAYLNTISKYNEALEVNDKAIEMFRLIGDKEQESVMLNNKGNIFITIGRFNEAIEAHILALKLKEELKIEYPEDGDDYWDESIAASYWNIGNIYGDIKNYETSYDYYNKAESIYERLNLIDDLMSIRNNIAINYKLTKQYNKAIATFKSTIAYDLSQNYFNDVALTYDELGHTYYFTDSLEKAKLNYQKSIALFDKHKDEALKGISIRHLGQVYMKEQQYRQALVYFNESLGISTKTNAKKDQIDDHYELAKAYAALGNYNNAYENYDKHTELYKDVFGKENIEKINELEIRYDTERKEKALIIKDSEIELLEVREEKNKTQRNAIIIAAISALSILLLFIYGLRQKMKRNKLVKEKLDAELDFKKKELTTHALHLAKKNELLEGLKQKANELKTSENTTNGYQQLIRTIDFDLKDDNNWENFAHYFQQVHKDFNQNVTQKYPEVTPNELRLISLVKMNLSITEMANILNISVPGVKKARQRLRKKMSLSTKDSLEIAVLKI
jgi:tetratricopeptide (TPR) repeat protein